MPISYTTVGKPGAVTYTGVSRPDAFITDFIFQDGENYLFQDGVQKTFANNTDVAYTKVSQPSVGVYTSVPKPS